AWRPSARHSVDKDRRVRVVEQREREVESTDAEIGDTDAVGLRPCRQPLRDRNTESVVPEKDIPDPGHQYVALTHVWVSSPGSSGSMSSRLKKKRCPGWRIAPRSRPGSSSTS